MKTTKHTKLHQLQQRVNNGEGITQSERECSKCKRQDHLTVDHIIPAYLLMDLGLEKDEINNNEENFDILCRWCNRQKSNKLDHLNPKTIPLLKKYVARYEEMLFPPPPSHTNN